MSTARRYIPHYTVEDYQLWTGDWELWNGVAVAMTPSPFGKHSKLLINVGSALKAAIDATECDATVLGEIDWVIAEDTVLRPDLVVVCGREPEKHVADAPAIAVEIQSDGTRERDLTFKRAIYQNQAVKFYLIVDPDKDELTTLKLNDDGEYLAMECSNTLNIEICDNCRLRVNVGRLFR
jgi:Uma2 family endonuclease